LKITWDYLAGFVDGEGCISIYDYLRKRTKVGKGRKHKIGVRYGFYSRQRGVKVTMSQAWRVTFNVTQKNNDHVLNMILKFITDRGIHGYLIHNKGIPIGVQVAHHKDVFKLLSKLLPKLIVKHGQAKKAIAVLKQLWPKECK
jgi:hypothetical protein